MDQTTQRVIEGVGEAAVVKRAKGALLQSIVLDRSRANGLGAQIGSGLRLLILEGALRPGERLPASRILAQELGVARATVVDAFERLQAEGLLETRVGSGTYVGGVLARERPGRSRGNSPPATGEARLGRTAAQAGPRLVTRIDHQPRAFSTATPAFDAFPMARWSSLAARHWRGQRPDVLGYPDPYGHPPLREAIASHLRTNRGIDCEARQIFVTGGAQQAFQILAQLLLDPGDRVWFEDPGAIGARNALILAGAAVVAVPVDDQGLSVERGRALAPDFRLAFVTPAHQQPLGAKMSLSRRFALLQAADEAQAWIIEDDWDGEFCFSGQPLPPLKGLDSAGRVIYVGTFSKSLFPALRLGFMVVPERLLGPFQAAMPAFAPTVPVALQATVADFIAEGDFAAHVRRMRRLYSERHQILQQAVARHLANWLDFVPTTTGLHTPAFFRHPWDASVLAEAARSAGVEVTTISAFATGPVRRDGLVLGFAGFPETRIEPAARLLAGVFDAMAPARH